jgi:transcriptional regulator
VAQSFELLRGTLDLLILKALTTGPRHGLGISRRIEQVTGGTFQVKPGSLFPALHRLEERGWLRAEWGVSETNRRARYYELTPLGKRQFAAEVSSWHRIAAAINLSLAST